MPPSPVVYGLTFGYLRGCVLRDKLARFSMLWWCAAIAAVSFFFLPPEPEALGLSGALNSAGIGTRRVAGRCCPALSTDLRSAQPKP